MSNAASDEMFVDIFRDEVVGLYQFPDLELERVLVCFLLIEGNTYNHAEPFGEFLGVGEYEHVSVTS